jgi:hypothetical protein
MRGRSPLPTPAHANERATAGQHEIFDLPSSDDSTWDHYYVSSVDLPHAPLAGGERLNQNWADVGAPSRATVWRHIRAFRYQGAGRAERGKRKAVFSSALEQAEQLFDAADIVGYASRPILLFYGLSQAGRAIAAASTAADNDTYMLVGHGIKVSGLGQHPPLHELTVVDDSGSGSFIQLANLLRSGTLPGGAPNGLALSDHVRAEQVEL